MAKGITNETRGSSLKKFKPNPSKYGGLCIGALVDVTVSEAQVKDDSNMSSFQGKTVPRLNFVFESRMDAAGVKKSTYIHSYLPIEHTPESLNVDAWRWDTMSQTVKHLLDVFREEKPLTPEEEAMLVVDFVDEEDGMFVEQPAEVVIEAYKKFFNNIVALFNPEGKAIFKDANGKDKVIWMKLILDRKGKPVNNGDYGFSGYPGEGLIELYKEKVPPSISINIPKGENIIPKPLTAAAPPTPTGQGASASQTGDTDVPDFMRQ
jgi:hypothetical protein